MSDINDSNLQEHSYDNAVCLLDWGLIEVQKRDGTSVEFDHSLIYNALHKAFKETGEEISDKDMFQLVERVSLRSREFACAEASTDTEHAVITVENIQDFVISALYDAGYQKTGEAYVNFRKRRDYRRRLHAIGPEERKMIDASMEALGGDDLAIFQHLNKYSRFDQTKGRREIWIETVNRNIDHMAWYLDHYYSVQLSDAEKQELHSAILTRQAMPSMRHLQMAGPAAQRSDLTIYNCSYVAIREIKDFADMLFILMQGTGAGFSVESENVEDLPKVKKQKLNEEPRSFIVPDSTEGWCEALRIGMEAWFEGYDCVFDVSQVRPAGALLLTKGGRASGPQPLIDLLNFTRDKILSRQRKRLRSIDVHDICCMIGQIVQVGGVRRAAQISLSDLDDMDMRYAKSGEFWNHSPQRIMSNNSAVYNERPTDIQFMQEWLALAESGSGERGIFNRGQLRYQIPKRRKIKNFGVNPCFSGDTLVALADGRGYLPFKQLAEEGKDVDVYTMVDGELAIRKMRNPRVTGYNKQLMKITLDTGDTIRCTPNHKWPLRDGRTVETKDLVKGDSIQNLTGWDNTVKVKNKATRGKYRMLSCGSTRIAEHRIIAANKIGRKLKKGEVVHHINYDSLDNSPRNLQVMLAEDHTDLHRLDKLGDKNPMRRAKLEWSEEDWKRYHDNMSAAVSGELNGNYSGKTVQDILKGAKTLVRSLGRSFNTPEWYKFAGENGLPQSFSSLRQEQFGGVIQLSHDVAVGLDLPAIPVNSGKGSNRWFVDNVKKWNIALESDYVNVRHDGDYYPIVTKKCEHCGAEFEVEWDHREQAYCSIACGTTASNKNPFLIAKRKATSKKSHTANRETLATKQMDIFNDIKVDLGRVPDKKEWQQACKSSGISMEMNRDSSPFQSWAALKESAALINHRVVSVEPDICEDVYNGTVDDSHQLFVGGFKNQGGKFCENSITCCLSKNCGEILLRSRGLCNLSLAVIRPEDTLEDIQRKVRYATILGTIQSAMTRNFPYVHEEWTKNAEEERLLGVDIPGAQDNALLRTLGVSPEQRVAAEGTLRDLLKLVTEVNKEWAAKIGINESVAVTCAKPGGNSSVFLGVGHTITGWQAPHYIRNVSVNSVDPMCDFLKEQGVPHEPKQGQDPSNPSVWIFKFPVKAPEGSAVVNNPVVDKSGQVRLEAASSALDQLESWLTYKKHWTEQNPSVTCNVAPNEWLEVGNWLLKNWENVGGLSFLPREDRVYLQAPMEECTEERYNDLMGKFPKVDWSKFFRYEVEDTTTLSGDFACTSGVCVI